MVEESGASRTEQGMELLTSLEDAALMVPPMQKLFVTGNILPGTDLSPERLEAIVHGLGEVTCMNLFGAIQVKTPDHYDQRTFDDLGRAPQDINVSWMWDDSGGQVYIFPDRAYWTTLDIHTCKEFDSPRVLDYLANALNFRSNMRFSEQTHQTNEQWQVYRGAEVLPETPFIEELEGVLGVDLHDSDRAAAAGSRLEEVVYQAVREGWGDRLASLFSEEHRQRMRELHGAFEVGVDDAFMNAVLVNPSLTASDYRFQSTYDRLARMEAEAVELSPTDRIIHIGTGWPGTAIGLYQQQGNPVTCVEIDPEVAAKSRAALERLGLYGRDKLTVVTMDGREVDPRACKAIIVSAMVPSATICLSPNTMIIWLTA